jgi:hypothetical protein
LSKRNKKSQASPASSGSAPELTVVDGEVVGVAPGGEGDGGTEVIETAETNDNAEGELTAEPVVDEEVLALLADDGDSASATTVEPEITAEDVDAPTDQEILGAIDASGTTTGKKSGAKRAPKTPAAPMREFTAVAQIDQATLDANLAALNAKKVREKAENLIAAITHGKKLSGYTKVAVAELQTNGRISGKSMTDAFLAAGLKEGTARAQAQQMTSLFRLVGAVAPDASNPRELVLQDNGLIQELAKIAA